WAARKLRDAKNAIPGLLEGPDAATPEFQDWESGVKRALRGAFGESHFFVGDFDRLTMVHAASKGRVGDPSSWRSIETRVQPHEVLRRANNLLGDALEAL